MTTVAKKDKKIDELHFEHQLWVSESSFFKDELKIYQNRLNEVAVRNTSTEVRKQIEHFQNQFIIQKEQLDILTHHVNEHEQWLAKYSIEHPVAIDRVGFAGHDELKDKIQVFKKLYTELKIDFLKFVATWL